MLAQHVVILETFEEYQSALNQPPLSPDTANLLATDIALETVFERHANEEIQLLREISSVVVAKLVND